MWGWIIGLTGAAALTAICVLQYRSAASTHRPLSERRPQPRNDSDVPLGLEAIDMETLSEANRRNESLERGQLNWLRSGGFFGRADTDVAPWADDATYAARFHAAFQNSKSKD